jgi:hypothetical protein
MMPPKNNLTKDRDSVLNSRSFADFFSFCRNNFARKGIFALIVATITFLVIDKIFLESVQESVGVVSWFYVVVAAINIFLCFYLMYRGISIERLAVAYMSFWFASGIAAGIFDENVMSLFSLALVSVTTGVAWYFLL